MKFILKSSAPNKSLQPDSQKRRGFCKERKTHAPFACPLSFAVRCKNMEHTNINKIALLILTLITPSVSAYDYKTDLCSNTKFLNCTKITNEECINSYTNADTKCIKQYPLDTNASEEQIKYLSSNYGECHTKEFLLGVGIDENDFEKCGIYLESTFTRYSDHVTKMHNLNQKKLRKLEELQYE